MNVLLHEGGIDMNVSDVGASWHRSALPFHIDMCEQLLNTKCENVMLKKRLEELEDKLKAINEILAGEFD